MVVQGPPLELGIPGTAPIPFMTKPGPYTPGQPAIFHISFSIYVTGTSTGYRNIFAHNPYNNDWGAPGTEYRSPSVYLTGDVEACCNRIHFNFGNNGGTRYGNSYSWTSAAVPLNTWYNVVISCDGTTAQVYMNGTHDWAADFRGRFFWPSTDYPWNFCNSQHNPAGSLKIANVTFSANAMATNPTGETAPS